MVKKRETDYNPAHYSSRFRHSVTSKQVGVMDSDSIFRVVILVGCLVLAARGTKFHLRYFLLAIAAIAGLTLVISAFNGF
ncbi:Uncharacterised protein [Budvicia aquatica]|uniref:Uncharacterized protein n=2 Tax=Budvicia aquatica TaxID=82979 RepID=A0A484ZUW1_9GAMM|nr:Uncharacterised protein [Budvicia aquatica]